MRVQVSPSAQMKPKILVILGPTASGKSDLAVKLAKKFRGEVISADSRQVYKGLDIGTGKITKKEMGGIHHWLLDVISPKKNFNVEDWRKLAEEKIYTILKRNKLPIICGGTGFYIESITKGTVFPEVKPNKKLREELKEKSKEDLYKILVKLDKSRAKNIDKNNPVRLIRAIEIAKALGKVPKVKNESKFDVLQIGIKIPPEILREKINKRLEKRIKSGMIQEAIKLHKKGVTFKRMRELGLEYRYLADYLENKVSKNEMQKKLETEIWKYSKRQRQWFKRDKNINWHSAKDKNIELSIRKFLK